MNPPTIVPYSVTLPDGTPDRFAIKQLPISKLYQWLYLAKDQSEPAMVALVCDRSAEWVDNLDVDVFAKLAAKCHEVVFPQAVRLAKGAPQAAALLAPIIQRTEMAMRVIAILSLGSGDLLPKPQQQESAPATPSASLTPTVLTPSAA